MKDSRILKEWLDANGNKISIAKSAAVAATSKGDFTEKFKKLYSHIDSVWGGLNIIKCSAHTLAIYYGYGQKWYHLIIRYIPEEGCFEINLSERRPSDKLIYAGEADSWAELLDILMQTETIKNRKLCEWVDAGGNKLTLSSAATSKQTTKATGGYREKFIKLLDYHMKHLPPTAFDPEIKIIQDDEFVYEEHHATGDINYDYDQTIAVAINKHSDDWDISVYQNGTLVKVDFGNGWEALLKSLRSNLSIPAEATPDYQKLLEWIDGKGNKINFNNTAAAAPTNDLFKDRFTKLAKHIEDCHSWSLVNYMSEWELDLEYEAYGEIYSLDIDVNSKDIKATVYKNNSGREVLTAVANHDEWSKILASLWNKGIINDISLCEWVDNTGNKISANKSTNSNQPEEVVYIWDMYFDPMDKGTWCSAEKNNGEYDGFVFKTKEEAFHYGRKHLYELDDEGELRGDPDDYDIDTVAIPKSEVSDYTLRFSGL